MHAKANHQPLVRVVKRVGIPRARAIVYRILAVVLALVTGGIFLWALGQNPFTVYATMAQGAVGTTIALKETVKIAIPLCITSLGITLAFKMRFWNIGAEGQICLGAIAASYFALFHSDWPQPVLLMTMALAGILAGGLWGVIPAVFKARFGTNETLLTLMLNYVASYIIQFLREGPWKDPGAMGFPKIAMFDKAARMPTVLGVHAGWIIALVLVVVLDVLIGEFWEELGFLHSYQMTQRARDMQSMLLFGFLVYFVVKLVGNKRRLKNLWQYEEEARWQKDERRILIGEKAAKLAADLALAGLVVATFVVSLYNMDAFNALYYTLLGFVLLRFGCWLYVRRKY